jgi:D-sedoheptulose 7-phosphate isomerase
VTETSHYSRYFSLFVDALQRTDTQKLEQLSAYLSDVVAHSGRLFIIGLGGSAANCSHAAADLRRLCGIQCEVLTDNISEFSARINDEGWDNAFSNWLMNRDISERDAVMFMSVGGGNLQRGLSTPFAGAIDVARKSGAAVIGIVGKSDGLVAKAGDCVVVLPDGDPRLITPLAEAFQAVVWHALVSDPELQIRETAW